MTSIGLALLQVAVALFYLQFGLQALTQFLPQGALALGGAAALGWAAVRTYRGHSASPIALWGTLPILLLHGGMTIQDRAELPFLVGSIPVPLVAGFAWLIGQRRGARKDPSAQG